MLSSSNFGSLLFYFIVYGIGFTLGSFGGLFSEVSGIINIALEGSMVVGAFSGITFTVAMSNAFAGSWLVTSYRGVQIVYILASIISIIFSVLFSFLLSFVSIKLRADQTIVGTALNTVAITVCTLINTFVNGKDTSELSNNIFSSILNVQTDNGFIKNAFSSLHIGCLIGVIAIIGLIILMNKTPFGLRLRACGENPQAADSVGINVSKMRYIGTAIGCGSAGFGGFIIFSCLPLGVWMIDALGYGFLVLAIEILGNRKSIRILFSALFFAVFFSFAPVFFAAISSNANDISSSIKNIFVNKALYYLLPYLIAFSSLIFVSKKSRAPKAEGIPFVKGSR
jgi:simple sugar transport system permease protein